MQTYANSRADISISGTGGTLRLEVHADDPTDPTIAIYDPARKESPLRAVVTLKANGHLRDFFVEEKNAEPGKGDLVWFLAKKQQSKKRPAQKRPTKPSPVKLLAVSSGITSDAGASRFEPRAGADGGAGRGGKTMFKKIRECYPCVPLQESSS